MKQQVSNPLAEHNPRNLPIEEQKEWFKQQISLYYAKVRQLKEYIFKRQNEFLKRTWQNSRLSYKAMGLKGKEQAEALKKWRKDYKELTEIYCDIGSTQVSYYISLQILEELIAERKRLYKKGGFVNE